MAEALADQASQCSVLRRTSAPGVSGPLGGALLADDRDLLLYLGG